MHDVNILDEIMPEPGAFYVMDRAYVDFERLFFLTLSSAFFVVRTKTNVLLQRRPCLQHLAHGRRRSSCDGLLCSFDIYVGLESLQGTLIELDQATAGSIQISDQCNDQRDCDREKNQRQPKARCQR